RRVPASRVGSTLRALCHRLLTVVSTRPRSAPHRGRKPKAAQIRRRRADRSAPCRAATLSAPKRSTNASDYDLVALRARAFGQIKAARGFRQFLLRRLEKVRGQGALIAAGHNLLKLYQARPAL